MIRWLLAGLLLPWAAGRLAASNLDIIGVTTLRQVDGSLLGASVAVAQVEAPENTNPPPYAFEVNYNAVGQPLSEFTYYSDLGTATTFTNFVGTESGHADGVGNAFYGFSAGTAPQVAHVHNYEASYFYNNIIAVSPSPSLPARIVNQSFVFGVSDESTVNPQYDNYTAQHGTLFVSGVGNGDRPVSPAATCYNGIGVGVNDGASSFGPTSDGRCKPDVVAPGGATSFSTPYVSGAAAVLLQAGARGSGGADTNSAADARTLKALILNGAAKPGDWTNSPAHPLDGRYGAGVLNVYSSWKQLSGGKHAVIETTSVGSGSAHPPGGNANNIAALAGWNFATNTSMVALDSADHYYFSVAGGRFSFVATLVWQRQNNQGSINDLDLFLYDTAAGNPLTSSVSTVDNVEHVYLPSLPSGRYDLQVLKKSAGQVSINEPYALAFQFVPGLTITPNGNGVVASWPASPAGYRLQSTSAVNPAAWVDVTNIVTTAGPQNSVVLPLAGSQQFFRLVNP